MPAPVRAGLGFPCSHLCGFVSPREIDTAEHEMACEHVYDASAQCSSCGEKLARGPFMSVCLRCEPGFARECLLCRQPRYACAC